MILLANAYPVKFIKSINEYRYGLWMEHDNGDVFLKDDKGRMISAKNVSELKKISQNMGLILKENETLELDKNTIFKLLNLINPDRSISAPDCSLFLDFLNIIDDIERTLGWTKKKYASQEIYSKIFNGCDIPQSGKKNSFAILNKCEIYEFTTHVKYGWQLIFDNFWVD